MKLTAVILGFLLLIALEILRVYYIMPFPGSQEDNTIQLAYFLHRNLIYFRIAGLLILAYPFISSFNKSGVVVKSILCVLFGFYAVVFYMFNFRFLADKIFLQPKNKSFALASASTVGVDQSVLGVSIGKESKAYPIEIIGYHHQVRDSVGGQAIMVTYCTVCRTGRVYSPVVEGKDESFRLVGMDHYNAMFEDRTTGSWWRQVTGEAIVGPMKGSMLNEIRSDQMSLASWIRLHPETKILQPDTVFNSAYESLADYDEGTRQGRLERKDSLPWMDKSWVIGISIYGESRAYDWKELQKARAIADLIGNASILLVAHSDKGTFQAFDSSIDTEVVTFSIDDTSGLLTDSKTGSLWNWNGECEQGELKGRKLETIQSYQEYWHSWKTFHPQTTRYPVN